MPPEPNMRSAKPTTPVKSWIFLRYLMMIRPKKIQIEPMISREMNIWLRILADLWYNYRIIFEGNKCPMLIKKI